MKRSEDRILTTHAGSLPRPPDLVRLFEARARGEAIDLARLTELGRAALARAVRRQAASGLDIGNDGEQEREGFFLYVQHRMSGFGGQWERLPLQDVNRYPLFAEARARSTAGKVAVSNFRPPKAVGEVRYLDPALVEEECAVFRRALEVEGAHFVEPFLTAPSPGIVCSAMRNEHYDTETAYLGAVARALQVEYETIVRSGFLLQLDCPDLALERHLSYQDRSIADFVDFVDRVIDAINRSLANVPRIGCGCTCAGATTRARTTVTWRSRRSCPPSCVPTWARSPCRSRTLAMPTSSRFSSAYRLPVIRSSSPGSSTP